ncbi:MoaD/ThiS family protein [Agilicoccus flavus]|uniref:MoaD/ThiS family protein n=1 Tax=Agilicoccus flavus TaxID=2775968 RepID=UPI001CF6F184|nr:MoaD/ThiS family protein [Agilicoccus flavus]
MTADPPATPIPLTVRYFAAAAAAAGVEQETRPPGRVGDVLAGACDAHPGLETVAAVSTFLLDGLAVDREHDAPAGSTLDVLPPFAGG